MWWQQHIFIEQCVTCISPSLTLSPLNPEATQNRWELDSSFLHMRKTRLEEIEWLAQGYSVLYMKWTGFAYRSSGPMWSYVFKQYSIMVRSMGCRVQLIWEQMPAPTFINYMYLRNVFMLPHGMCSDDRDRAGSQD